MGVGPGDPAVRARKGGQDGVPGVGRRQAGQIFTMVVSDTTIVPQDEMYKIERELGEQGGQGGHGGGVYGPIHILGYKNYPRPAEPAG